VSSAELPRLYAVASDLFTEAALRVREGRRPEDIDDALVDIGKALDAAELLIEPAAGRWRYYQKRGNKPLFDAISTDHPGQKWQRVFALEIVDPHATTLEYQSFHLFAKSASGSLVFLLYDGARHDLEVLLNRWSRFFTGMSKQAEAKERAGAESFLRLKKAMDLARLEREKKMSHGLAGRRGYSDEARQFALRLREENPQFKARKLLDMCREKFGRDNLPINPDAFRTWLNRPRKPR
jgi:hypothetical protein